MTERTPDGRRRHGDRRGQSSPAPSEGIKATKEGYLVRRGLQVGYTVDGKEYSDFVPAILAICTSPDLEDDGWCPLPEGWSEFKDS